MNKLIQLLLLGSFCVMMGGCSDYIGNYQYSPRPLVAQVPGPQYPPTTQPQGLLPPGAPPQTPPQQDAQPQYGQPQNGQPQYGQPQGMPPQMFQQAPPSLTVLATIIGVHRADKDLGIPDSVEVRLRIDDNGPYPVNFDPQTLELTNGQLSVFGPPIVHPNQMIGLQPQQTAYLSVFFPFPDRHSVDDTDMNTLQLRWRVQVGGQVIGQIADFHRVWTYDDGPYYYRPYYAYPVYPVVSFGFGWGGRWHR